MKKSNDRISIKQFMRGILTPPDSYYGEDSHISKLLYEFRIRKKDTYNLITRELNLEVIPNHTQKYQYYANCHTKQFTFLLTMIHSGLNLYNDGKALNEIPTNEYIIANAAKLELSSHNIKEFLRTVKLPLPYFMFPEESDNTNLYANHLFDVFNAVFYGPNFDKEIHDYESMKPKTITEKQMQQEEIQRLREAKELQRRNLIFPKENDLLVQFGDISTEKIVSILEHSVSNRQALAQELKNRRLPLEKIGHLLIEKGDIDSHDANTKRAQRLLGTEKK